MEAKDWITIISVIAVIVGWFVNGYLYRRHEIFKRRMDLRFGMYDSCIAVAEILEKFFQSKDKSKEFMDSTATEFVAKLEVCQKQVLMYGTQYEIDKIMRITDLAKNNEHSKMKDAMAKLMQSIRESLRDDLKLKAAAVQRS